MRARQIEVTFRNILNRSFTAADPEDVTVMDLAGIVNRVGSVELAGSGFLTNGIIVRGTASNMKQVASDGARSDTTVTVTIRDGWQILENLYVEPPMVLDDMKLGAAIRRLLQRAGFSSAEMAGVNANSGQKLPNAFLAEEFAVVVSEKVADVLRSLMDTWGYGWYLWQNEGGVWQFTQDSATVVAAFTSAAASNTPGSYAILDELQQINDWSGFYNRFTVYGSREAELPPAEFTLWETIRTPSHPNFVGWLKPYPPQQADFARTQDDLQYVLRSLLFRYARTGRRWQFTTYFHRNLRPGMRITADGMAAEIEAINDASLANERMLLQIREVV